MHLLIKYTYLNTFCTCTKIYIKKFTHECKTFDNFGPISRTGQPSIRQLSSVFEELRGRTSPPPVPPVQPASLSSFLDLHNGIHQPVGNPQSRPRIPGHGTSFEQEFPPQRRPRLN